MPKIYDNGVIREMTVTELQEAEKLASEISPGEPTHEERIAQLEEALEMLLSGVTE